jgi:hypothetical protein
MSAAENEAKPQVLLIGSTHTANVGTSDPAQEPWVLRHADEVVELCRAISRFRPTAIAVEVRPKDQYKVQLRYEAYLAGKEELGLGEIDQIGFRVGEFCGVQHIHGFDADWQLDWGGLTELYPAEADLLAALDTCKGLSEPAIERARQLIRADAPIAELYALYNSQWFQEADHSFYVRAAELGAGSNLGGARYAASWYLRNLRMYAILWRLASQNERTFALVGVGHAKILNDLLRQGGRFTLVDPLEYLR